MTTRATVKPLASLSLDLDDKWSYLKTRGISSWKSLPSYLGRVVPRFLAFLKERRLTITVFVVGQDAALAQNRELLRAVVDSRHELGNHSFHHEPWLHLYSEGQIEEEIKRAEEAIESATGERPGGFRGPGYSLTEPVLRVLTRRGYGYDASTLPTFIGPFARAYYFFRSQLSAADREQRKALFGTLRDGLRPIRPYRWDVGGAPLVEIPVTTMPALRLPFHPSYVLYLSAFSPSLGLAYFQTALRLCRWSGVEPSLLLHPLDFLDAHDEPELAFFPAMGLGWERKVDFVGRLIDLLAADFEIVRVGEHARRVGQEIPVIPI